jgi:transcriptional regulator with XRE-family HTH domain
MSRPSSILGCRIQDARQAAGLSREQVAVDVGKSWATIRAYELGTATPPVYVLVDIAQLVGRSIDDLLRDEQVPA